MRHFIFNTSLLTFSLQRFSLQRFSLKISALLTFALLSAPHVVASDVASQLGVPVPVNDHESYRFEVLSASGYGDEQGRQIVDVLEGYSVNLALMVDTQAGNPVIGLQPYFELEGTSLLQPLGEGASLSSTDESGILEFSVKAGEKGLDRMTLSYGENTATVFLNIISISVLNYASVPPLEGGLNWSDLTQAEVRFTDEAVQVSFPAMIEQQAGDTVKVSGFMMPLEAGLGQHHFLLTPSPSHCFFHIPGGPAGVIEIFSAQAIETSWDPIQLEGRLALLENSDSGVIYQLLQAEVVD
jgi:hypothetical protein|tara:strand:- start:81 stop:974 length:894 start_codon:yes stop_codon:yes gene_type:complete